MNVIDEFKGLSVDEIKAILDTKRSDFATLCLNIEYPNNLAAIIRTHNAFGGKEIFYIGKRKFDPRGAVGTHHYESLVHFPDLGSAKRGIPKKYHWVAVENGPSSRPLTIGYQFPKTPLFVFGNEKTGLDNYPELRECCQTWIKIEQYGSVRSLNVSTAAGIVMFMYRQNGIMSMYENSKMRAM